MSFKIDWWGISKGMFMTFVVVSIGCYLLYSSIVSFLGGFNCVREGLTHKKVIFWDDYDKWGRIARSFSNGEGSHYINSRYPSFSSKGILVEGTKTRSNDTQTKMPFLYRDLEIKAQAKYWAPDTSCGYEIWNDDFHSAIKIENGALIVIWDNHESEKAYPIPNWQMIKNRLNTYRINWYANQIELYVNGNLAVTFKEKRMIPNCAMRIRYNAGSDFGGDTLTVSEVKVSSHFPRHWGELFHIWRWMAGGGWCMIVGAIIPATLLGAFIAWIVKMTKKVLREEV